MKRKTIVFALLMATAMSAKADVTINETFFPDLAFRNYVTANFDTNGDGKLSNSEIAAVKTVRGLINNHIKNLTGIEYFTALEYLDCYGNDLRSLDLSYNTRLWGLDCHGNQLQELILPQDGALQTLVCYGNQLDASTLATVVDRLPDVTTATPQTLDPFLLTVSKTGGTTAEGNILTPEARQIAVDKGWKPRGLDAGGTTTEHPEVVELAPGNFPDATFRQYVARSCDKNSDGRLSYDEIQAVTDITVTNMGIKTLQGVNYFTALKGLFCIQNQLTELELSLENLLQLQCNNNRLEKLNVSKCKNLLTLRCGANFLTTLDVSANTELNQLNCQTNRLTSLDVSALTKLNRLNMGRNNFDAMACVQIAKDLPEYEGASLMFLYEEQENNQGTKTAVDIAKSKGWKVVRYTADKHWEDYAGADPDLVAIDETNFPDARFRARIKGSFDSDGDGYLNEAERLDTERTSLIFTSSNDKVITSMKGIEFLPKITRILCRSMQLTELDLSQNTRLTEVELTDCELSSLTLGEQPVLKRLTLTGDKLTTLDVSGCQILNVLHLAGNPIKGEGLDELFFSLPTITSGWLRYATPGYESLRVNAAHVKTAYERHWRVNDNVGYLNFGEAGTGNALEGDVNEDGDVGIGDIVNVTNIMAGGEE